MAKRQAQAHPSECPLIREQMGIGFIRDYSLPEEPQERKHGNHVEILLDGQNAACIEIEFRADDPFQGNGYVTYRTAGIIYLEDLQTLRFYRHSAEKFPPQYVPHALNLKSRFVSNQGGLQLWSSTHGGIWYTTGSLGRLTNPDDFRTRQIETVPTE